MVKNNIFYNLSTSVEVIEIEETLGSGCDFDNNIIYSPNVAPITYLGTNYSVTTWNALSFVTEDINDNPDFTDVGAFDFTLQAGSPAIDAGTDLSDIFTIDYNGDTRTGTWEIGAFQYVP